MRPFHRVSDDKKTAIYCTHASKVGRLYMKKASSQSPGEDFKSTLTLLLATIFTTGELRFEPFFTRR